MIDVIIPMLGRWNLLPPLVAALTNDPIVDTVCVVASADDPEIQQSPRGTITVIRKDQPGPGDYARKINAGYRCTRAPFVLLGASDLVFHPGWGEAAVRVAEDTGAGVVGTDDLANPAVTQGRHSTHPLVRRSYIDSVGGTFTDGPGVVYHEGYDHQCVDNELVAAAKARRQWVFAADSIVEHRHPVFDDTVAMDATYEKALRHGRADILLYRQREKAFLRGQ